MLLLLTLAILLPVHATTALAETVGTASFSPLEDGSSYSAILYDNTNGLPTSNANVVAQTSDGFIWIGCYSGLIRYDGHTFEQMDPSTGIDSVDSMLVDSKDRLWIGMNDSGLAMIDHWEIHIWHEEDGLPSPKVEAIAEGADGTIYLGTTAGVSMVSEDLTLQTPADYRVATAYVDDIRLAHNGLIYCLTNEGDYFTLRNGFLVKYVDRDATNIEGVSCIFPDPNENGAIYIGTAGTNLYRGDPKMGTESFETIDISPLYEVLDMEQIGDRIWIGARNGIGVLDEDGFHLLDNLPLDGNAENIMSDKEGNIWIASSRQGVMKIVPNRFEDLFADYGIPTQSVNSTCLYDGTLLIGTDTGVIAAGQNGLLDSFPLYSARTASGKDLGARDLLELTDGCRIRSILRDSQGRIWISTWRSIGLLRYDHGDLVAFTEDDGLISNHIRAVCETPDGRMLVACTGGASIIDGDQVVAGYGKEDGIVNLETLSVASAPNGDILIGSNGGGIYVFGDQGFRCIDKQDGLSSGVVMRIKYDQARDVFWLVTANSIAYMTSDYQVTTIDNFPYSNNFDLYENAEGEMWVLCGYGIYVASADELIANDEIDAVRFGIANGMSCAPTSNSYSELTPEGDLYISGNKGVVKVNIDEEFGAGNALERAVPFIDCDGKRYYADESGAFTLPSRARRITIYPYVFNYSLEDPKVSIQLEGFDDEPVTVLRSELGPQAYTNLPGGSYRFIMSLEGTQGSWGSTLSVPITKEKAFYEQLWFITMGVALVVLASVMAARAYANKKMRALEEKHREEAEHERIANELQMANQIQASMLPHVFPPFPTRGEFEIFAVMNPAREVGGDFYDFFLIDEDHLCLVIADVSGKGIPAALFMMISKAILQGFATMGQSPSDVLAQMNETLCSSNQESMFVTVWLGVLEISTGKLVSANAGHEYPAVRRADGAYELIKSKHGFVIGGMEGLRYPEHELTLSSGDSLFVYTDGVPEATNADNEMFGTDRMIAALNENPDASPHETLDHIQASVDAFVDSAEQFDDLTMLCLRYKGPSAS